jgi:hypothetical protein
LLSSRDRDTTAALSVGSPISAFSYSARLLGPWKDYAGMAHASVENAEPPWPISGVDVISGLAPRKFMVSAFIVGC